MSQDRIYASPLEQVGDFRFDERVAEVFPDMISRSVPGYGSVLAMTGELASRYSQPNTHIYDLGCSLGAVSFLIRERVPQSCRIIAVDSSSAMIEKLTRTLNSQGEPFRGHATIEPQLADVREVEIQDASFVTLNFTLQFIDVGERRDLLAKVWRGLLPDGALVLSEKTHFANDCQNALMVELHHDFKRAHGYSELEIAQKRTALENTLTTETMQAHCSRLEDIGFRSVSVWFQCFNFFSLLAFK